MTLSSILHDFAKIYEWAADPKEAHGHCNLVSRAFKAFLLDMGLTRPAPRLIYYSLRTARHYPLPVRFLTQDESWNLSFVERELGAWVGHTVVGIGRLRVDWTARQFFDDAPFPFLWQVRSSNQ